MCAAGSLPGEVCQNAALPLLNGTLVVGDLGKGDKVRPRSGCGYVQSHVDADIQGLCRIYLHLPMNKR